jgi:hypothetical protein
LVVFQTAQLSSQINCAFLPLWPAVFKQTISRFSCWSKH